MNLRKLFGIHTHQWKTVRVTFTPPLRRPFEVTGFFDDSLLVGATNVTQECTVCSKIVAKRYIGKVNVPGFTFTK